MVPVGRILQTDIGLSCSVAPMVVNQQTNHLLTSVQPLPVTCVVETYVSASVSLLHFINGLLSMVAVRVCVLYTYTFIKCTHMHMEGEGNIKPQ